ncbi:hypothetical protein Taro_019031 [Colocasia esculenta]|uniref:Uncharacterized protein n=1 Tax=Colocasia esculenta TaxID=4460 RepID=A0A843UY20_COLES|nr:hypothetical protein [Colocasia esculenta]
MKTEHIYCMHADDIFSLSWYPGCCFPLVVKEDLVVSRVLFPSVVKEDLVVSKVWFPSVVKEDLVGYPGWCNSLCVKEDQLSWVLLRP